VLAGGQLNPSLTLDHLCRNKLCMNPAHLEQVTAAENIKRAARLILHCRQGHPLSGDNMRVDTRGKRICKTCKQAAVRRTYRRARKRKQAMSAGGSTHGSE
jgi:hypothetical protein